MTRHRIWRAIAAATALVIAGCAGLARVAGHVTAGYRQGRRAV